MIALKNIISRLIRKSIPSYKKHSNISFYENLLIHIISLRYFSSSKRKSYRKNARLKCEVAHQQEKYDRKVAELRAISSPIRVAFFVMYTGIFSAEPLFKKMLKDSAFAPFIVIIPDISRGKENMHIQLEKAYNSLACKYNNVYKSYDESTDSFIDFKDNIDIYCQTVAYEHTTHEYYKSTYLNSFCLSIYFNYAYTILSVVRKTMAMDFTSLLWKYFLENKDCLQELTQVQAIRGVNAVVSGYIKMDDMGDAQIDMERKRKRILICPHQTVINNPTLSISNFLIYADFFLELPLLFPGVDFVFRPHPLLFTKLRKLSIWTNQQIDDYLAKIETLPNMTYDESGTYYETFVNSDAMIHDCGSFIAEYLFTGKPMCFMFKDRDQLDGGLFMPLGRKCIDFHHHAYTKEDILYFIQHIVLEGNDPLAEERQKFARERLQVNYPEVSTFVINYLKDQLGRR